jgi:hypothetical protein
MSATVVPPSNVVVTNCPPNVTVSCSGGLVWLD